MATDAEVAAAGFRLPKGTDLIQYGDDAISANARAAYEVGYVRSNVLASGDNPKTLEPGVYGITAAANATAVGMPIAAIGSLTVNRVSEYWGISNHVFHAHPGGGAKSRLFVRNVLSGTWSDWTEIANAPWYQGMVPRPSNLNDLVGPGYYGLSPDAPGYEVTNRPIQDGNAGIIEVFEHGAGRLQRYTSIRATNQTMWTRRGNAGGQWWDWTRIDPGGIDISASGTGTGGRREILQQGLRARKGNTIGTGGLGAVALRFDDAAGVFKDKVLPMLEARSLPFTRVTTTDRVGQEAGGENDTWANIQDYSIRAGGEVWNHGKTHGAAESPAAIDAEVSGALEVLRANLPRLPIDCWSPPGGQSSGWGGYMPADTIEQIADSYAGQQIFAHHALASGYLKDTWYPTLDGVMRDGGLFYSSDIRDFAFLKNLVDRARDFPSGVVLMFHSNNIGTNDYITDAEFEQILDYIVAERNAGNLLALTVSGLAVADAESDKRRDLLKTSAGTNWSETIPYPQYRPGINGATVELIANVAGTAGATVTSTIGESTKTHTVPTGGNLELRHPATIPLDATSLSVSIAGGATADAHLYAV